MGVGMSPTHVVLSIQKRWLSQLSFVGEQRTIYTTAASGGGRDRTYSFFIFISLASTFEKSQY